MMMKTAADLLKEEFATRYGLDVSQIAIDIRVDDVPTHEIAEQITKDYAATSGYTRFGSVEHFESNHTSYWVMNSLERNFNVTAIAKGLK